LDDYFSEDDVVSIDMSCDDDGLTATCLFDGTEISEAKAAGDIAAKVFTQSCTPPFDAVRTIIEGESRTIIVGEPIATFCGNGELYKDHTIVNPGSIHTCDKDGRSPTYTAASTSIAGESDILTATFCGNVELVKGHIIVNPASIHTCDKDGRSPTYTAAMQGHVECLKLLLAAGGDVNKCRDNGISPISCAVFGGHTECLKLLLAAGGDVNKCNNDGCSPIYVAAMKGRVECLKLLLAAGGDVNKCRDTGESPIYAADLSGHADCIKLLMDAGGNVGTMATEMWISV
jgi:hypothetical protein